MSATCLEFTPMQVYRFLLIMLTLVVWIAFFYIHVRKSFYYLNFWSITFTLVYLLLMFFSSGHQMMKYKKGKDYSKALKNSSKNNFKRSKLLFRFAFGLTLTSTILYSTLLWED